MHLACEAYKTRLRHSDYIIETIRCTLGDIKLHI